MNRRNFLAATAGSALWSAVPGRLHASALDGTSDLLRIGVIGSGRRGQLLTRTLAEISGVSVESCCDILPFRADEIMPLAAKGAEFVDDYRRVLDRADIDAVVVASPFHLHAEHLAESLDAGKHVYCEKTLVKGHEAIESTRLALEKTDRIVQTGYQHRYSALYRAADEVIQSGAIGEVGRIEAVWNRNNDWRRPVPSPELERIINWRMYREYSGGLTAELTSHQMEIANWLLRDNPSTIQGSGGFNHWNDGREVRDSVDLLVKYRKGAVASFSSTNWNDHEKFQITIMGTGGTISLDSKQGWLLTPAEKEESSVVWDAESGATRVFKGKKSQPLEVGPIHATRTALESFRDSIWNNVSPLAHGMDGLETARMVQLSLDAMDEGRVEVF